MCSSDLTVSDGLHALREVRLMRWLGKHPNIIALKDLMVDVRRDALYVVMEMMDTDLHRIIQSPQPLGDAHYKHFMYQLLRGLRFAHRYNVIHRDLKPANLLVTKNCDLVISDFGLARQASPGDAPMTEHVVTRWYRAPELMLSADGHYTRAVDVWSCGCILAEMLGRTPLFGGKDFMETITMQINVLGTRPADELAYIRSPQALAFLAAMDYKPPVPWATLYPEASDKALHLLDRLLQFHPEKRISVDDALAHPYFDSVRAQYVDPEPVLPLGPGGMDFSFEGDASLRCDDFRRLLTEEAVSLRAEKGLARALRAEAVAAAAGGGGAGGAAFGGGGGAFGGAGDGTPGSVGGVGAGGSVMFGGGGGGGSSSSRHSEDDAMAGGSSAGIGSSAGRATSAGIAAGGARVAASLGSGSASRSGVGVVGGGGMDVDARAAVPGGSRVAPVRGVAPRGALGGGLPPVAAYGGVGLMAAAGRPPAARAGVRATSAGVR